MAERQEAVKARFLEPVALQESGRWQDAADAFAEVVERHEREHGGAGDLRLGAMCSRVTCFHEMSKPDDVISSANEILAWYVGDDCALGVKILADVLWLNSRALGHRGSIAEERKVLSTGLRFEDAGTGRSCPAVVHAVVTGVSAS